MFRRRNVTPHTQLDFKVWSHHTLKADTLLGKTTLDLAEALEQHDGKCNDDLFSYFTWLLIFRSQLSFFQQAVFKTLQYNIVKSLLYYISR